MEPDTEFKRPSMDELSLDSSSSRSLRLRPERMLLKRFSLPSTSKTKISHGNAKSKWSDKEIRLLMKGLDEHGITRIDSIVAKLPFKTKDQIKQWLWKMSREAYKLKQNSRAAKGNSSGKQCSVGVNLATNERGKRMLSSRVSSVVTKSLLLLGNLEDHPTAQKADDIDFDALYRALYMVMKGYPVPKMNEATLKFFIESFEAVLKVASSNPVASSTPVDDEFSASIERIAGSQPLNPLCLDAEHLRAPVDVNILSSVYTILHGDKLKDWLTPHDWSLL